MDAINPVGLALNRCNNVIINLLSLLNMVEIKAETADVTLSSLKDDVDKILALLVPVKNDVDKIKKAF